MTSDTTRRAGLLRLLQLASPALPIGGYSYSQGLEWAVDAKIVHDAASAQRWIGDVLDCAIAQADAPVLVRAIDALARGDDAAFLSWNTWFRASRETRELRAETEQMAVSLVALARALGWIGGDDERLLARASPLTLPAAFALCARGVGIAADDVVAGYLWAWLDNQVLVAMKTIPLGQVAGQRMLASLAARIEETVRFAASLADDDLATFAPGLALASSRHETQYSRLFRS